MKLTNVLFRIKPRLPKGNIWSGKYRLERKVTPVIIANTKANLELEEQNMFYLRHPYLTPEQSYGHASTFKHKQKFAEKIKDAKIKEWEENKHRKLGDRFGVLKISESWD